MSHSGRRIACGLLLAFLAGALPLAAAPSRARLLAPEEGAELAAGHLATVEWEGAPPPRAEEWEAFLSVDGGRTYPLRITPHLNLSIRRFSFRVPDLPTRSARVLLRFGDERREVEVETPQRFAITPGSSLWEPTTRIVFSRGERPRPSEEGVVLWVEGTRDGSRLREVAAVPVSRSLHSVERPSLLLLPLFWPARARVALASPMLEGQPLAAVPPRGGEEESPPAPATAPVRLLIHRFNE
jgi:hypothetical protein